MSGNKGGRRTDHWPHRHEELLNYYRQENPVLTIEEIGVLMNINATTLDRRLELLVPKDQRRKRCWNFSGFANAENKARLVVRVAAVGDSYGIRGTTLPPLESLKEPCYDSGF